MTPEQFAYWMQGAFEVLGDAWDLNGIPPSRAKMIRDHLALVFEKVTPDRSAEQSDAIHDDKWPDFKAKTASDLPDPWSWVGDRTQFTDQLKRDPSDPWSALRRIANDPGLSGFQC